MTWPDVLAPNSARTAFSDSKTRSASGIAALRSTMAECSGLGPVKTSRTRSGFLRRT